METEHENRLKAALCYTVGKMCEEQETNTSIHFNKQMIGTLNEILWRQIKLSTKDLEAFSRHGKRSTINLDDVKLLVRRNEDLKEKLEGIASDETKAKVVRKKKTEPVAAEFDLYDEDSNNFS